MIPGLEGGESNSISREGPGPKLRAERERRRLEISVVADQLNLKPAVVEALESDDIERLPEPVFTRGYIRNYAALLALDPEPLLADYKRLLPEMADPTLVDNTLRPQMQSNHLLVRLTSALVIVALLGALVFWLRDRDGAFDFGGEATEPLASAAGESTLTTIATTAPVTPEPAIPLMTAVEATPVALISDSPEPVADAPQSPDVIPEPVEEPPVEPASAPVDVPAVTVTEVADTATVADAEPPVVEDVVAEALPTSQLLANKASWVDIRDADGRRVKVGTLRAGSVLELTGARPWKFVIGNASGVALSIDGQLVDLAPYMKGNVVRATLPTES